MRDDPAKAAEIEAALKKSLGARRSWPRTKSHRASRRRSRRGSTTAMRGGKTAEDAIKDAIAAYVHPQKVDTLKVLPAPPRRRRGRRRRGGDRGRGDARPRRRRAAAGRDVRREHRQRPARRCRRRTPFNRGGDPFPGLSPDGDHQGRSSFAFSREGRRRARQPAPHADDGFVVVQLKQHKMATREEFEKEPATRSMQDAPRARSATRRCRLYVKRLRDQAKDDIKIDESYVAGARRSTAAPATSDEDED